MVLSSCGLVDVGFPKSFSCSCIFSVASRSLAFALSSNILPVAAKLSTSPSRV